MTDLRNHILIVDDEFLIVEGLRAQIEDFGLAVCGSADTASKAIALAQELQPRLVLMDMRLSGKADGVDAALAIHDTVGSQVIFITGSREPATLARIALDHALTVLFKPVTARQLQTAIDAVMRP